MPANIQFRIFYLPVTYSNIPKLSWRVFENKVMRRNYGHKKERVTGRVRKLCNKELIFILLG